MLKLSTKGRYGTRVMIDLAKHYNEGYIMLKNIANRQEISQKYLEQIIPALKSAGLVISSRGAHGGYMLAKTPSCITLKQIIKTLEEDISIVKCVESPEVCDKVESCLSRIIWEKLNTQITETLQNITLADLISTEEQKNKNKEKSLSYQI